MIVSNVATVPTSTFLGRFICLVSTTEWRELISESHYGSVLEIVLNVVFSFWLSRFIMKVIPPTNSTITPKKEPSTIAIVFPVLFCSET
jgi:hypothetical protein